MPEMFVCERQNTRLTVAGCVRMFNAAHDPVNPPKPWESRAACVTCPIGAAHAGQPVNAMAEPVQLLATVCPRCLRQSDRIINGRHCISCYNRHAEALRGCNGKGSVPRLCAKLRDVDVAVTVAGEIEIQTVPRVIGAVELIVAAARHATAPMSFSWPACGPSNIEAFSYE